MKSAYEIAMERLAKQEGEQKKLTDRQKEELAEIDRVYDAKIAEKKVVEEPKIASLRRSGQIEEGNAVSESLTMGIKKLEQKREQKKDEVRDRS